MEDNNKFIPDSEINDEELDEETLNQVTGGHEDPNDDVAQCPNCGALRGLVKTGNTKTILFIFTYHEYRCTKCDKLFYSYFKKTLDNYYI